MSLNKETYGNMIGDIYGCIDGECKYCCKCNPIHYFGVRRNPPLPNKVQETLHLLTKYDNKNCNAYINAINMKLIDDKYNLLFTV